MLKIPTFMLLNSLKVLYSNLNKIKIFSNTMKIYLPWSLFYAKTYDAKHVKLCFYIMTLLKY